MDFAVLLLQKRKSNSIFMTDDRVWKENKQIEQNAPQMLQDSVRLIVAEEAISPVAHVEGRGALG